MKGGLKIPARRQHHIARVAIGSLRIKAYVSKIILVEQVVDIKRCRQILGNLILSHQVGQPISILMILL